MDNVLVLAYIGDAIYELYIREYLINKNIVKVELLQKEATKYVSAKAQAIFLKQIDSSLTQEEKSIVTRARNHKGNRHPKNTDILTYKHATGLEAVIGYLYLNNKQRLEEIMKLILEG